MLQASADAVTRQILRLIALGTAAPDTALRGVDHDQRMGPHSISPPRVGYSGFACFQDKGPDIDHG
jgi:hypothetical protein